MLVLLGLFQKCYFWIENTVLLQWQKMVLNKKLFSREIAYALWLHLNLRIFFSAICYQIYEVRMHLPAFLLDFLQFMPAGTWVASKCYLSKSEIDFHQNNAWQLEIWPKSASRKKFEINWNYFFSHHFHCSRCQILQLLDIQEEIERQKFIRLIKKVCTAEVVVVVRPFLYYNIVLECVE